MIGLDPVAIRAELEYQRSLGVPFSEAWKLAAGPRPPAGDERALHGFMCKHFRAAYDADGSEQGRCMIPPRDVSSAIPTPDFASGRLAPVVDIHLPPAHDSDRCRSGDGCDRPATRGRFGKMWCEHHGAELERLTAIVTNDRRKADPRNGGNDSLYTHEAAA